jgi:hypothetical protein
MGDRAGVALALKMDLGVVDRARGVGQQHELEIDPLGGRDLPDETAGDQGPRRTGPRRTGPVCRRP